MVSKPEKYKMRNYKPVFKEQKKTKKPFYPQIFTFGSNNQSELGSDRADNTRRQDETNRTAGFEPASASKNANRDSSMLTNYAIETARKRQEYKAGSQDITNDDMDAMRPSVMDDPEIGNVHAGMNSTIRDTARDTV